MYDSYGTLKVASLLPLRVYKDSYPYQLYVDNLYHCNDASYLIVYNFIFNKAYKL